MNPFLFFIIFAFFLNAGFISLTEDQYANLPLIHSELKKKDANFVGLSGSKEKMEVLGMGDDQALKEIRKMDFKKLSDEHPENIKRKSLTEKFKAINFDAEMLEQIGLISEDK